MAISGRCSQRWTVAYIGIIYGIFYYMLRVNLSVSIVSMTEPQTSNDTWSIESVHDTTLDSTTTTAVRNSTTSTKTFIQNVSDQDSTTRSCDRLSLWPARSKDRLVELKWDKTPRSMVLSAFFFGSIPSQIPSGWVAGRYGGKRVIGVSMAMTSLLTILFPVCARTTVYLAIANRVVLGFFLGATSPAWFNLLGVWALPHERSRFTSMFWSGTMLGTIIGYSTAGYLCATDFDNGWGSVFYVHGICSIIFTLCWYLLVFDSPEKHPRIHDNERELLRKYLPTMAAKIIYQGYYSANCKSGFNLAWAFKQVVSNIALGCNATHLQRTERQLQDPAVPWKHIMTSLPVLSIFVTHVSDGWLLYFLMSCLPLYMNDVLNFDIESNGLFSSLPFLTMAFGLVVSGTLADFIMSRKWLGTTNTRKLFQIAGNVLSAACIVAVGFIPCDRRELAILCLCLCVLFDSLGLAAGYASNIVDVAPMFASEIWGISNTFTSVSGLLSPIAVSEMTTHSTQEEWRHVFYLTAGILCVASVVYAIGASGKLANWVGHTGITIHVTKKQSSKNPVSIEAMVSKDNAVPEPVDMEIKVSEKQSSQQPVDMEPKVREKQSHQEAVNMET